MGNKDTVAMFRKGGTSAYYILRVRVEPVLQGREAVPAETRKANSGSALAGLLEEHFPRPVRATHHNIFIL